MQIRDLKIGDTLYIYDRSTTSLELEKVIGVSAPHLDKNNAALGMMVDVTINKTSYCLKDTSEIGYTGSLAISADRSAMLREIESQKASNEAQIARVDSLKAELPKLESIIDLLNPERKEKKANEERLSRLEESIGSLKDMVELVLKTKKGGSNGQG